MPRYRFTIDTEASDPEKARLNIRQGGGSTVACDELNNATEAWPVPRSVIVYRRATTSADSPGDFLPHTDLCQWENEHGNSGSCDQIAVALVSFSDGFEQRVCRGHLQECGFLTLIEVETEQLQP